MLWTVRFSFFHVLVFINIYTISVDIHFQYNGILFGFLVLFFYFVEKVQFPFFPFAIGRFRFLKLLKGELLFGNAVSINIDQYEAFIHRLRARLFLFLAEPFSTGFIFFLCFCRIFAFLIVESVASYHKKHFQVVWNIYLRFFSICRLFWSFPFGWAGEFNLFPPFPLRSWPVRFLSFFTSPFPLTFLF